MSDQNSYDQQEQNISEEMLRDINEGSSQIIDPNKKSNSSSSKIFWILGLLIILGISGFFVWKYLKKSDSSTPPQAAVEQKTENAPVATDETVLSEEYKSDKMLIDFKHPSSWKVKEDGMSIEISSPESNLEDVQGNSEDVAFKINIKRGADEEDSKYLGKGLAIEPSRKAKYSQPSAGQRKETFITDFGLNSVDNFAYFVVQGNFNLKKNETLGPNYANETEAILISGGFKGAKTEEKSTYILIGLNAYKTDQNYNTALEIVKSIKIN